jgi:hypothetical protein
MSVKDAAVGIVARTKVVGIDYQHSHAVMLPLGY